MENQNGTETKPQKSPEEDNKAVTASHQNAPYGSYPSPQSNFGPPQGSQIPAGQIPAGVQIPPGSHQGYQPPPQGYSQPQGYTQPGPGYGAPGAYPAPAGMHPAVQPGGQPGLQPGMQPGPVINQPYHGGGLSNQWMAMPQQVPHCPPGLEYLAVIDTLLVHQKLDLLEAVTGYENENKYTIHNSMGQKVYQAVELSDQRMRSYSGSLRPFEIKILDNFGNLIMNLKRPMACKWCCFPCCLQKLEVFAPPGNLAGTVEQEWSILHPRFVIKEGTGNVVLRIKGPVFTSACCSDVDFQILTADESNEVGKISKQWAGYVKETYTAADNFAITFPMDLDARMKSVMLGACFLIDMMYYEESQSSSNSDKVQNQQPRQPQQPLRPV